MSNDFENEVARGVQKGLEDYQKKKEFNEFINSPIGKKWDMAFRAGVAKEKEEKSEKIKKILRIVGCIFLIPSILGAIFTYEIVLRVILIITAVACVAFIFKKGFEFFCVIHVLFWIGLIGGAIILVFSLFGC